MPDKKYLDLIDYAVLLTVVFLDSNQDNIVYRIAVAALLIKNLHNRK